MIPSSQLSLYRSLVPAPPQRPLVEKLSPLLEIVGVRMREAWGGRDARECAVGRGRARLRGLTRGREAAGRGSVRVRMPME